jgi:hypothetical protein
MKNGISNVLFEMSHIKKQFNKHLVGKTTRRQFNKHFMGRKQRELHITLLKKESVPAHSN